MTSRNDVFSAYKRKEYGWFVFYIAFVVIASRIAGVIGAVVSVLVVAGLYKTLKSPTYSTNKKMLLSASYLIGGIIVTFVAATLFMGAISQFMGDRAVDSLNSEFKAAQSRSLSDQSFTSSSTPNLTSVISTAPENSSLESVSYIDPKYKFSIRYPKGWTIDTSGTDVTVEFDVPTNTEVALMTVTAASAKGYDLQTYSKNIIQGFFSSEGGPNANLKIIAQGNTSLAGQPAYQFEVTADFINKGQTYPIHGIYVVSVYTNIGYVVFASSFEELWSKYRDIFNASIASFTFPE